MVEPCHREERSMVKGLAAGLFVAALSLPVPVQARVTTTTGPEGLRAVLCLDDPEKGLAWIRDVRDLAGRLGLGIAGISHLSRVISDKTGFDLLTTRGWEEAGLDPEKPLCAMVAPGERVLISFGVDDWKKARDTVGKVAPLLDARAGRPRPGRIGKARAWTFHPGKKKGRPRKKVPLVFAVRDGAGYLAEKKTDLRFLGKGRIRDYEEEIGFPEGDVVLAGMVDFAALAESEGDVQEFAADWLSTLRGSLALGAGRFDLEMTGNTGSIPGLLGSLLEKGERDTGPRVRAVAQVGSRATGFTQVQIPMDALFQVIDRLESGDTGTDPETPPGQTIRHLGPVFDLLNSMNGDLTLAIEDGMAGVYGLASLSDPAGAEKAIMGLPEQAGKWNVPLTLETLDIKGDVVWLFRFGEPSSWFRFPLFVAQKGGVLHATISRARIAGLLEGPKEPYLDGVDNSLVKEGFEQDALLVSHAHAIDLLGNLMPYAAVARDAIFGAEAAWLDLFELPALALDLMDDASTKITLSGDGVRWVATVRFLDGDPDSADPGARAFGKALRARYAGRMAAWREALMELAGDRGNPYGRKAWRCLVQPDSMTDALMLGAFAGVAAAQAAFSHGGETGWDQPVQPQAASPCESYLMKACLEGDPESPECRKAQGFFDNETGFPAEQDQKECLKRLDEF